MAPHDVLSRLENLWHKLDEEGWHVKANTVALAIEEIKGHQATIRAMVGALEAMRQVLAARRQQNNISYAAEQQADAALSLIKTPTGGSRAIDRQPVEVKGEPYHPTGE